MCGADLAGLTINHRQRVAGIVDEQLLPATVALPHRQRQSSLPTAEQVAIPAVPVSVGMLGYILPREPEASHVCASTPGPPPTSPALPACDGLAWPQQA